MNKRSKQTIRSPKSFRPGAFKNAMAVDGQFQDLVKRKKNEIISLVQDLQRSKAINYFRIVRNSSRALYFETDIGEKIVELRFIIWTDDSDKPFDFTNSRMASFVLRPSENIEDTRLKVLRWLEGIKKGCLTEYLHSLTLKELERERIIHSFHKTGRMEDKFQRKDFAISILKDGLKHEIYLQVKSSEEALMAVKDELLKEGIAGSHYSFTGDLQRDVDAIKKKIVEIIEEYKKGNIIVV